jgi:hypothetical protein
MHCNGKCYLAKQLKEQEQQEHQSHAPKKEQFEIQLFFSTLVYSLVGIQGIPGLEYFEPAEKTLSANPRSVFHPPSV